MDHPYYTFTVTNLTRGWAYTTTEGEEWDPADNVVLASPFTYSWGFKDDLIPAQLDVFTAAVHLVARTSSDLPVIDVGDLVAVDVRVGTTGQRVIAPPPMRVAASTVTLGNGTYKATLAIGLSDLSVDWRNRALVLPGWGWPQLPTFDQGQVQSRVRWLERMAEYSMLLGLSVARQSAWSSTETLPDIGDGFAAGTNLLLDQFEFPGNAEEELEALINSHIPAGITYSWATIYSATYPTGYQWCAPSSWYVSAAPYNDYPISDPGGANGTTVKIVPVPASRVADTAQGLPLVFAQSGGQLILEPRAGGAGTGHTALALDAKWCVLPAQARRARDGAVNAVTLIGPWAPADVQISENNVQLFPYGATTFFDTPDMAARGYSGRDVPVKFRIAWALTTSGPWQNQAGVPVANAFLSDPSIDASVWSYDGFELRSSLIPQAVADWLLSLVAPRLPGETDGDGRVVRHVTIHNIDPDLRFDGAPVTGFVTGGSMTMEGGDIVWKLDTTPGLPQYASGVPAPLTVSEMVAAGSGLTAGDTDPLITIADLAYVDH